MGNNFRDFWASVRIFVSNFNARYGRLFNAVLLLLVLSLVIYALVRPFWRGARGGAALLRW